MIKKWKVREADEIRAKEISEKFDISMLTSNIIANKNLSDEEIEVYLNPVRSNLHDPFKLPDMRLAVDRIIKAINENEKIIIYGDYDADGITSTTVLKRFFSDRGIEVDTYIPNRLDEGYGLNKNAIEEIAEKGFNLIITVDCGITAIEEVELGKKLGIDIIITDHHETLDDLPKAIAVVDAKRKDNKYPFKGLAGCGVAFKLTQALCKELDLNENECLKYLDIVTIGTISDIVPLVDENRVITKLGLKLVAITKNLGLKALLEITKYKKIDSTTVSFGISPRINACGRMGHQEDALNLFLTNDPIEARKLAKKIEEYNKERQDIEKNIYNEAKEIIEKDYLDKPSIVIGKEGWHHGVIGIVSSKITEEYYKPSILVCFENEEAKGSGRSIPGFDLHEAITKCSTYLTNCGGHSMAIGLSLEKKNFEKFKEEFEKYSEEKLIEDQIPEMEIDEVLTSQDLELNAVNELKMLEPFGEANSEPIVMYKNIKIESIRTLSEGKHLKLSLKDDGNILLDAIGFNMGSLASTYQIGDKIDVAGNIGINSYNNVERVQIVLRDMRFTV